MGSGAVSEEVIIKGLVRCLLVLQELMQEVNSAASTERVKQLEEVLRNSQQLNLGENKDLQSVLQSEPNLTDPSINLFQIPPEMLYAVKEK